MSNSYTSKTLVKPLKGGAVTSNYGSFDTLNASSLKLESLNIAGVFEDGVFINVVIQDSELKNTVIGIDGANVGYFTELQTRSDVTMYGNIPGALVYWDPNTGIFTISSELNVGGCSQLGNIRICNNDIKSTNFNGDINVKPNGIGTINMEGPIFNRTSNGNYYTEVGNGSVKFLANNDITVYSSHGSAYTTTLGGQEYTTYNGDLSLNVETKRTTGTISNVNFTNGNIIVTTPFNHYLTVGNIVTINNEGISGDYTVGSIITDTKFGLTTTTNTVSLATGGTFLKTKGNNIILNSQNLVKIPENTKLTFGETNNVNGNTDGIRIFTNNDVIFEMNTGNSIIVPDTTRIQLGTSGSNYINYNEGSIRVGGTATSIETTNVKMTDPIITIGDYTLSNTDNKDRGVEFRYYDTTTNGMKLGWFGYKETTKLFTFIPDATNNGEIISGTPGNFELNNLQVTTVDLEPGGTFNANCGKIINLNLLTGCGNTLTIAGSTNVTINGTNRISLAAGVDILVPNNIPIAMGTNGSMIKESTNLNVEMTAKANIEIKTQSNGSISIPSETGIRFNGTSNTSTIVGNTRGELIIKSNDNIYLTTTIGSIIVPENTRIKVFTQEIWGNTSGMSMLATQGSINNVANSGINTYTSTGNIEMKANNGEIIFEAINTRVKDAARLIFGMSGTDNSITASDGNMIIEGNVTNNLTIKTIESIRLSATNEINIPTSTKIKTGDNFQIYTDANNITKMENLATNGNVIIQSDAINITSTGGTMSVINDSTNITTGTFIISSITPNSRTEINTDNLRINDRNITIGTNTIATQDGKDRGIEYNYRSNSVGSMSEGWFGRKDTTGRFTYYVESTNTNDVISGTIGNMEMGSIYIQNELLFTGINNNLDMNCGTITKLNTINGCSGDITINGTNSITNVAKSIIMTTENVNIPFNTNINFGNTSNSISCTSVGNVYIKSQDSVIIDGNIQVRGMTTTVNSTVTNIKDPIISIGGLVGEVIVDDNKDRGIEFKWYDGGSKVGFFGFKDNIQRFVVIKDGVNNSEVFSGQYSDVQFGDGYFTGVNLENGNITGVNEISGGTVTIKTTMGNINISPTQGSNIIIPYETRLSFGTTENSIRSDVNDNMIYTSGNDTTILANNGKINLSTTNEIDIPANVPLYIGSANLKYDMSNKLEINNSQGDIYLTPQYSTGNINIPTYNSLNFASTSNSIYSDGNELIIRGYNGINFATSSVTFDGNVNIIGTITATGTTFDFNDYILPLGTYQVREISNITNSGTTNGNIRITTSADHNLNIGDNVIIRNTDSTPEVNGTYTITYIESGDVFYFTKTLTTISIDGSAGTVKSNLTTQQGKDVGIQVNYWTTTGNSGLTAGTLGFKTGFFGFDQTSERWTFINDATISNSVVTGNVSDIEVNKVYTSKMSGYVLEGGISGGSNAINGTNFGIGGGSINNTAIGINTAQSARFTTLSNTVTASLTGVTLQGALVYNQTDRYTLSSGGVQFRSPSSNSIVSMFSVTGTNYTGSSGTMPSTSVADGTYKILVSQDIGIGCNHTIHFGAGKLIAPNAMNASHVPTKLIFKRKAQSAQLVFDGNAWILLSSGCYVE